ncbi:MAG TPA: hypothetical protein VMR34_04175 [Candidatus Saccharimonadales bacterium]|nr:hypothetical protein [Candidatus Saccharimonadales bacterium]
MPADVKVKTAELASLKKQLKTAQGPANADVTSKITAATASLAELNMRAKACGAPKATTVASNSTINANSVAQQIEGTFKGYGAGQLSAGTSNINWADHVQSRGTASFSHVTLTTQAMVASFINASNPQSEATKARIIAAYQAAGASPSDLAAALNGSAYFPLQMNVASEIEGTTYFSGGQAIVEPPGDWRSVGAYDVYWLPITSEGKVIFGAAVRADCGNSNVVLVVPFIPGKTPATASVSCFTSCTPVTPQCPCAAKVAEATNPPGVGYIATPTPGRVSSTPPPISPTVTAVTPGSSIPTGSIPPGGAGAGQGNGLPGGVYCDGNNNCSGGGTPTTLPNSTDTTTVGGDQNGETNGQSNGTGGTTQVTQPS